MKNYWLPRGPHKIICKVCGVEFTSKGPRKFCSEKCRGESNKKRYQDYLQKFGYKYCKQVCPICGKIFEGRITKRSKRPKFKYCSRECKIKFDRRAKYQRICLICGAEFLSTNIGTKTCSDKCCKKNLSKVCSARFNEEEKQTKIQKLIRRRYTESIRRKKDLAFSLNNRIRSLMYSSLRKSKNGHKWQELVGYSVEDLRHHLEKQFKKGMSWEKFLAGEIHIDHKIPVSKFNFKTQADLDFERCWSLENLQPLWSKENIGKGNKLIKSFQPSLRMSLSNSNHTQNF